MASKPHAPARLRRLWPGRAPLLLMALAALVGCDAQPQLGLVAQNPVDAMRPYFHDFGTLK